MHMHIMYAYMHNIMNMQKGPNMRGGNVVENEDVKKCQTAYFLIKRGICRRFPRCKIASEYIPDLSQTIPYPDPANKKPIEVWKKETYRGVNKTPSRANKNLIQGKTKLCG